MMNKIVCHRRHIIGLHPPSLCLIYTSICYANPHDSIHTVGTTNAIERFIVVVSEPSNPVTAEMSEKIRELATGNLSQVR